MFLRIIKSLERYAAKADIGTHEKMRFVSDNVVVEIWDLKPSAQPVIGLAAQSKNVATPFKTEDIATVYNRSHLYDAKVDAAIELPSEVFNRKEKGERQSLSYFFIKLNTCIRLMSTQTNVRPKNFENHKISIALYTY